MATAAAGLIGAVVTAHKGLDVGTTWWMFAALWLYFAALVCCLRVRLSGTKPMPQSIKTTIEDCREEVVPKLVASVHSAVEAVDCHVRDKSFWFRGATGFVALGVAATFTWIVTAIS